jgi:hypothetical protein
MTANLILALAGPGQAAVAALRAAAVSRHEMPARRLVAGLAGRAG